VYAGRVYESPASPVWCVRVAPCTRLARGSRAPDRGGSERGSGAKWRRRSCIDVRARSPPPAHTPAVSCERVARRLSPVSSSPPPLAASTARTVLRRHRRPPAATLAAAAAVVACAPPRRPSSHSSHPDQPARLGESSIVRANSGVSVMRPLRERDDSRPTRAHRGRLSTRS